MAPDRRYVLAAIVCALGLLTGAIILEVLGTAVFAVTVAYVLIPVHRWLTRRGLTPWWAAAVSTLLGFVGVVAVFSPIVLTLYVRREDLLAMAAAVPTEFSVAAFETTYTVEVADLQAQAVAFLQDLVVSFATALPVLAIKFALFVSLLFAIMLKGDAAARAAVAPVPQGYRSVVYALATRARETLYAIYVLQVATGIATMALAYPLFWLLGYENALALAVASGILQFVPIVGPSILVLAIAGYHVVVAGDPTGGALVGVLGLVLIGWLPDVLVRPRLARHSAGLPGSLYFVGFTGGLFTLGPIGIVVGPLVVAVFVEAVDLLSEEVNGEDMAEFDSLVEHVVPPDSDSSPVETEGSPSTDRPDDDAPSAGARTDGAGRTDGGRS